MKHHTVAVGVTEGQCDNKLFLLVLATNFLRSPIFLNLWSVLKNVILSKICCGHFFAQILGKLA